MKHYIIAVLLIVLTACYKDKGNYDYVELKPPVLSNFDSSYIAYAGDSLIIAPVITLPGGKTDFSCNWSIMIPEEARSADYEGKSLRIVYGLGARNYTGTLVVTDNSNEMKYFYNFTIIGRTAFTTGIVVLSEAAGGAKLSFVKPDGSIQPNIYEGINGEALGTGALQIVPIQNQGYMNIITAYWVLCSGGTNPAVQIDANNMQRLKYLKDNFFEPPAELKAQYLLPLTNGTTTAIINEQMYMGTFETAPFGTYYGYYGVPVPGSYKLFPQLLTNSTSNGSSSYMLGFESEKKSFVRIIGGSYFGTEYDQIDSSFNPKDLKMDLIRMEKFNDGSVFAFCDSAGKKIELKFAVDFLDGNTKLKTLYKREFPGASLLTAETRWAASPTIVFYFSSGDKIYRYNPENNDIIPLVSDFGGKTVTMIKLIEGGNKLLAGIDGSILTLDVSVGKNGNILQRTDGIPGKVIDMVIR
jgi:hypothetical protein